MLCQKKEKKIYHAFHKGIISANRDCKHALFNERKAQTEIETEDLLGMCVRVSIMLVTSSEI